MRNNNDFLDKTLAVLRRHGRCFLVVSGRQVTGFAVEVRDMFANELMMALFYMVWVVPVLWVLRPARLATPF